MALTQSQALARYMVNLDYAKIPKKTINDVKTLVLDCLGISLYGSKMEGARIAADFFRSLGEKGESTVIGRGFKASAISAALCNGMAAHSVEYDDVDPESLFHLEPSVIAPTITVAERQGASGRAFLTAAVGGCDIMTRLAYVMNPTPLTGLRAGRGFHTTPVCGAFAAAAAAGKLLGLNEEQITSALGLAGAQAAGTMQIYEGSMQKRFNAGVGARNGVTAALLASRGFTGETAFLEGDKGFGRAYAGITDWTKLTEKLGEKFPIVIEFKPYPSVRPVHNAIDCAFEIRSKYKINPDEIEDIALARHPAWADWQMIYEPRNFDHATFSLPLGVGLAFVKGAAGIKEYANAANYTNPQILGVAKKIKVSKDPSLPRAVSVVMTVRMKDGSTYRAQVDYAKGHPQNPMTREELIAKFRSVASAVISEAKMTQIVKTVDTLEEVKNMADLCKLLH